MILPHNNCNVKVLNFTQCTHGESPYICLNYVNYVYSLTYRIFNMHIFATFLFGCFFGLHV